MFWHGGGGLDSYLDTPEFTAVTQKLIKDYYKYNPLLLGLNKVFQRFFTRTNASNGLLQWSGSVLAGDERYFYQLIRQLRSR